MSAMPKVEMTEEPWISRSPLLPGLIGKKKNWWNRQVPIPQTSPRILQLNWSCPRHQSVSLFKPPPECTLLRRRVSFYRISRCRQLWRWLDVREQGTDKPIGDFRVVSVKVGSDAWCSHDFAFLSFHDTTYLKQIDCSVAFLIWKINWGECVVWIS